MRYFISISLLCFLCIDFASAATINASTLQTASINLLDKLTSAIGDSPDSPPEPSRFEPARVILLESKDTYTWFHFTLHNDNDTAQTLYLSVPHVLVGDFTLIKQGTQTRQRLDFGHSHSAEAWPLAPGKYIAPLSLQKGESAEIYFRVFSKAPIPFQPRIGTLADIENDLHRSDIKYYLLTGFIAALFIYILLAMLFTGNLKDYRYYLTQIGLFLALIIYNNGWLLTSFLNWPQFYEAWYSILTPLVTIFQLLFLRDFFNAATNAPVWNRILLATIALYVLTIIFGVISGISASIQLQALLSTPMIILYLVITLEFWRRKFPSSGFICTAYISYFVLILLSVAAYYGVVPFPSLMYDGYQFGIGLQLLLFGLAIAHQSRVYRERETAMRVEAELARKESLAKTSFLTHMSHELRTPLNGVIGMAQLLEKTELNQQQRYYSDTIVKSGNLLLALINDVLDFSKISSGKLSLEQHPFNFLQSLGDCLSVFIPTMVEKQVPVHLHLAGDCPQYLIADEYRIEQIILNLVSNALKFTRQGEVNLRISHLPLNKDQIELHIDVEDTGEGMEQATLDRIFSEFTQEDVTTTRKFGGTGLGLSIIKKIIELMDGKISVSSEKNSGSCFTVTLPVEVDKEKEQLRIQRMQNLAQQRILINIEHGMLRELIAKHLEYWQAEICYASSDAEISELLKHQTTNCIITHFRGDEDFIERINFFAKSQVPTLIYYTTVVPNIGATVPGNVHTLQIPGMLDQMFQKIIELTLGEQEFIKSETSASNSDYSNWQVLIVEDNPINQAVAHGIFKSLNIDPDISDNGAKAVQLFIEKRYPLIFMDCEMPIMDGYEATRQIRALENGSEHSHIIALTAHALQHEHEQCFAAGMDGVITKPVTIDKIQTFIKSFHYPQHSSDDRDDQNEAGPVESQP